MKKLLRLAGLLVWVLLPAACEDVESARYAGRLEVEAGRCSIEDAPPGGPAASLAVRGRAVVFSPDSGVVTLPGRIDAAGHVTAGMTLAGAEHKPFTMAFEGDLRGGSIVGQYATPRCRAGVRLERAP